MVSRQRLWQIKNRDKHYAQLSVGKAVVAGIITPAAACEDCGTPPPLQAHHHLGYAKEHRLHVRWLCQECHTTAHVIDRTLQAALSPMPTPVERVVNTGAEKNQAAVAMGRLGGAVKSEAKAIAARMNGKKGGRPRKLREENSR